MPSAAIPRGDDRWRNESAWAWRGRPPPRGRVSDASRPSRCPLVRSPIRAISLTALSARNKLEDRGWIAPRFLARGVGAGIARNRRDHAGGGRYSTRGKHLWTQTTRTCRPSPSPQLVQVTRAAPNRARANLRMAASPRRREAKSTGNGASRFAEAGLAPRTFPRRATATATADPTAENATETLPSVGRRQVSLRTNPTTWSDEPPVSSSCERVAIASLAPPSCCFLSAS